MNIFVLDADPTECVKQYCDAHVVKMLLETTQILCGVHHHFEKQFVGIYKPSHLNHPCVVWAGASLGNYAWTCRLLEALHEEFEYRRGKEHASKRLLDHLKRRPPAALMKFAVDRMVQQPFIFVGPSEIDHTLPVVERYRELYRDKAVGFKRPMRWTKRPVPGWMIEACERRAQVDAFLVSVVVGA